MKRTTKNERTNESKAAKRRREGADKNASRPDFSQPLRLSTAALALTCGVCVVVSGCRALGGADDERFRQGRGEYSLNDETVVRDWEEAAREAGGTARKGQAGHVGGNGQKLESALNAEEDPAASRPVLRSAAAEEEEESALRRVFSRKPVSGAPTLEEPEPPKSFSERVKGLFARPKKEEPQRANDWESAERTGFARSSDVSKNNGFPKKTAKPAKTAKPSKLESFARSGESKKTSRSTKSGFSLGRGASNVFSSWKRRGGEKFPVDPVLQYDESRFMPDYRTCEQYHSPLVPRQAPEQPLTAAEPARSLKSTFPADGRSGAVASRATTGRQGSVARISGRDLVADAQSRQTARKDASAALAKSSESAASAALAKSSESTASAALAKSSETGWGKTRPISTAANEKKATVKAPVASVGYLNASRKNETDFRALTTRCDRFFGWESDEESLLNAILEPSGQMGQTGQIAQTGQTGEIGGVDESLTAYSVPPTPSASAFSGGDASTFASAVAEIATGSEQGAQLGKDAATLTAYAPQTTQAPTIRQDGTPSSDSGVGNVAEVAGTAKTAEMGENAVKAASLAVLTAYGPSASSPSASNLAVSSGAKEGSDFASQLGEQGFDWFDSRAKNENAQPASEASAGATLETGVASSVANETVPSPVAETAEVASSLPVASAPVAEAAEVASSLPVASAPVAESAKVASSLPVAPATRGLTPVAAETLDLEAPRALAAVEIENATGQENGVAGPNFALAAPGLGAGEAIQGAVDERKNAAVAKPLSGDEVAWVEQIKGAIRTLVAERDAQKAAGKDVRRLDARLRLLYLAVDEYDRSIQEIQDDADPLKVFWETERGELETLLQSRLEEIDPTFVAERLRAGLDSLSGLCDLQIRKSALVVAPACFGLYEERAEGYRPGETVFAYAELEYVSCRETEDGRLIDVECRWRLLNADGSELTPVETQRCSNLSETKLRDVVLNVSAPLPSDLAPGTYLLETEVVDMNRPGAKAAKERLELTVVAAEKGKNAEKAAE